VLVPPARLDVRPRTGRKIPGAISYPLIAAQALRSWPAGCGVNQSRQSARADRAPASCDRGLSRLSPPRQPAACPCTQTVAGYIPLWGDDAPLTDCHIPGTVAGVLLPPRPCGRNNEHPHTCHRLYRPDNRRNRRTTLTGRRCRFSRDRKAGRLGTPATRRCPPRPSGFGNSGSPPTHRLSAEGRPLEAEYHAPAAANRTDANTPGRQQEHAGNGGNRRGRNSTLVAVR
jgi:hypothetical protein